MVVVVCGPRTSGHRASELDAEVVEWPVAVSGVEDAGEDRCT